jgi:hypothetical protein
MRMGSYRKRRKNKEFSVGKHSATGDNTIVSVRYITMPLTRIKVGVEVGFTEKKNRDEANRRSRNIKGIEESETARGRDKFNSAHADSGNRMVTETSDRVRFNRANGREV